MLWLPQLKVAILVYFKHPTSKRKLTTNEVCSLLGDISEVTTRIQGSVDTHINQTTFIMKEMVVLKLENHLIYTGEVENGHNVTEETAIIDLTQQAQPLVEVMESNNLGKATLER